MQSSSGSLDCRLTTYRMIVSQSERKKEGDRDAFGKKNNHPNLFVSGQAKRKGRKRGDCGFRLEISVSVGHVNRRKIFFRFFAN